MAYRPPARYAVPTGIFNFSQFHKYDFFYVDKTRLIIEVVNSKPRLLWYLFPRGFGKTINLNMLYNFFDHNHTFNLRSYYEINSFPRLKELQNRLPVIYLNFTDSESISVRDFFPNFKKIILRALNYYPFIFSDKNEPLASKLYFQDIYDGHAPAQNYITAIRNLIKRVAAYNKTKVLVIIDGYDDLYLKALEKNYYAHFHRFFTNFLKVTLNDNPDVYKIIIGGIYSFASGISEQPYYNSLVSDLKAPTPMYFTQQEATQLMANAAADADAKMHIKRSFGHFTPDMLTVCPRLLVASLTNITISYLHDPLFNMIKTLDRAFVTDLCSRLLAREKVAAGARHYTLDYQALADDFQGNLVLALINYGVLGFTFHSGTCYAQVANDLIHQALSEWYQNYLQEFPDAPTV